MVKLRLLSHRLQHLRCDALATSANAGLVGNANPNFWRFAGRKSADGELHKAAGPALLAACAALPTVDGVRCRPGCAVVTSGSFKVHATHIIHAVAPDGTYASGLRQWWGQRQWSGSGAARGGQPDVYLEEAEPAGAAREQLQATVAAVLQAADEVGARSLGLPAIGCGVLGWRADRAAGVALRAIAAARPSLSALERIDVALPSDAVRAGWLQGVQEALGLPERRGHADESTGVLGEFDI